MQRVIYSIIPSSLLPETGLYTWLLKWFASIIQIMAYTATAFDYTPLNKYLIIVGLVGWFGVGLLWRDRAIILIHAIALAGMLIGMSS